MIRTIFVIVNLKEKKDFDFYIEENKELLKTAGYDVVETIIQQARSLDPKTAIRSGKLEELKKIVIEQDAQAVVFYNLLTFAMQKKLQEELGVEIIDRAHLILNIFEKHAGSKEAKRQTELARLRYALPQRVKEKGAEDQSGGGSLHNKGSGESRSALQAKANKRRIAVLEKEIKSAAIKDEEKKRHRKKSGLKKVALIGYTNVGKSSLLKALMTSNVKAPEAKDQLFATLDVTVRRIEYKNYVFLAYDTVGFVSDLPHELIDSFRSTLSSCKEADLLLLVSDITSKQYLMQKDVALKTLETIGASDIPYLEVFNKVDLVKERGKYPLEVSANTLEGIDELKAKIASLLYPADKEIELIIKYHNLALLEKYKALLDITYLKDEEEGKRVSIKGEDKTINELIKENKR